MVRNGDYVSDGAGGFLRAEGTDELLQRVLWKLSIPRGSFPLLPALGSELHRLGRAKPAERAGLARQYVAQALSDEAELSVAGVELSAGGELTVELDWRGEALRLILTVEELYGQMVDTFQRETGMALAGDGDMAVRLYAVAAQLYALYVQADWVGRQCFPQTAQGDYLDKHAQLRGLERRAATAAVGVLSFETDHPPEADLSIPEGTVCMTAAQVRFETTEAGVLKAGQTSAQVRARAVEPGAGGNAAVGTVRAMAVAPVGVSRCTNPEAFSGGLDAEGDESLRERVLETFRRMPNGANAAFYQQEALSFPEVAAATVVARPRGVGTVDVFLATAAGLPDSGLLEQVAAHLEERREIAVDVQVKAPEVRTVDVSVQVAARPGADFNTVRQAVESAVRGWFDGRLLGQSVLRAQLGALIFGVEGVENYALTAPAADVAAAVDELPQLGTLTVAALEGTA